MASTIGDNPAMMIQPSGVDEATQRNRDQRFRLDGQGAAERGTRIRVSGMSGLLVIKIDCRTSND